MKMVELLSLKLYIDHYYSFQAYAPELFLLEATPEVRAVFGASSEGSTRPQTRTSYDYNPFSSSQSKNYNRSIAFANPNIQI